MHFRCPTGGEFKSLADLCDRVDLRAVNRRALEALIHCGAFDNIESNRNQLIHDPTCDRLGTIPLRIESLDRSLYLIGWA